MLGNFLRLKIAIVLAVLGLLVLGTGIGQRTIWLPPATLTASAPAGVTPAPLTVVGPELLNTRDGKFTMTVKSDGPIQLAVARERDINGWIGDAAYTMVGGANDDFTALSTESKAGAEKVPNPAGSDMWVSEEKATGELTYTWQSPGHGDWALLLSSDGTAPAPTDLSITVDNESGTPWAVPLMIIGSALLALAALLFFLAPRKPKTAEAAPGRRSAGRAPSDPATGALEVDKIVAARGTAAAAGVPDGDSTDTKTTDTKSTDTSDGATGTDGAAAATKPAAAGDATAALPASLRGDTEKSDSVKSGTAPAASPSKAEGAKPAAGAAAGTDAGKQDADSAAQPSPEDAASPKTTGLPVAGTAAGLKGAGGTSLDQDPAAGSNASAKTDAAAGTDTAAGATATAEGAAKASGSNAAGNEGSFMKNVFKRGSAKKSAGKDPKSGPDKDSPDNDSKGDSGPGPDSGSGGNPAAAAESGKKVLPADEAGQQDGTKKEDGKSEFSVSRSFELPADAAKNPTAKKGLQMKARWGAALAVVLVAGSVGPAVADDSSTPAPAPSVTAEAPATSGASSTAKATEDSDAPGFPNLLDSQVQRIAESVATVVASADNAKDAKVLEARAAGTALQMRTANYKIRAAVEKQEAAEPVNATKILAKVVTTTETWPRSAMFVTQGENNALPQLLTLVQTSPRENYKLTSATPLLPGQTFPTVDKEGTKEVALDSADGLKMSPEAAISALSDRLTKSDSKFKDSFNDSVYITSVFDLQKKVAAEAKDADYVFSHKGNKDTAVSMRTADGGALVVVDNTFGIDATSKANATLTVGDDAAVFTGGKTTTTGFNLNYAEPVVMYIPPASGDGKITLVSATRALVGASFK